VPSGKGGIQGQTLPSILDLETAWREHTKAIDANTNAIQDMHLALSAAEARLHEHIEQVAKQLEASQLAELEEQIRQMRIEFDARLQVVEAELKVRSVGGEP
jgi:glutathione S-transferase